MKLFRFIITFIILILLHSCYNLDIVGVKGIIYENYRRPFTKNLNKTPFVTKFGKGKIIQIKEPFTNLNLSAEIKSNAIGDIAKKYGIKTVYWADMEYFNLLGIWKERILYIYGK